MPPSRSKPATSRDQLLFAFGAEARILEQVHARAFGARLAVLDAPYGTEIRRVLVSLPKGGLVTQQSAMSLNRPERLIFAYEQAMALAAAIVPAPRQALMLGLGGGTMLRFLQAYFPDCAVTIVENDATVLRLARKYFRLEHPVELADAHEFVRHLDRRYDAIFVDLYAGQGFNLPEFDFWDHIAAALAPRGAVAVNWADQRDQALYEPHAERIAAHASRCFYLAPRGFKDNVVELCSFDPQLDARKLKQAAQALAKRQRRKSFLERCAVLDAFP